MELPVRRQAPALPVLRPHVPHESVANRAYWASSLYQCYDDEETCWIGTWCSPLLSGRTAAQFHVVNSMVYFGITCIYWGFGYCCFSHWQLGNDGISCHLWMLYMALFSGAHEEISYVGSSAFTGTSAKITCCIAAGVPIAAHYVKKQGKRRQLAYP